MRRPHPAVPKRHGRRGRVRAVAIWNQTMIGVSDVAGVALWFEVDDFDAAVDRCRTAGAHVETEPHENPNAKQMEIWLRDPDGYRVVLAGPSAHRPR